MKFNERYEILELVATHQESTSFSARDLTTGASVMLHVLSAQSVAGSPLLELARDQMGPSRPVLEISESKGKSFVVTDVISPFDTLRQWLEQLKVAPAPQKESTEEVGEFTRKFRGLGQQPSLSSPSSSPVSPEPGEFTRMFKSKPAPPPLPVTPPPTPTPPVSLKADPVPSPVRPSSPPPLPEPSWAPVSETHPDNNWVPKVQWSDANPVGAQNMEPPFKAPPPLSPPSAPTMESGPSEFTRVISRPRSLADSPRAISPEPPVAPPPAPQAPQTAPPAATSGETSSAAPVSYVPLILGFVVLFLIAVIVVVFFALKG
jgi:hypothetical protein